MAPLKILVCGGGIAGPALAFWLSRRGHRVVVVERFPGLRASGAQIDLRGQGIEAAKRMGLLEAIRKIRVDEAGFSFVDLNERVSGTIMANTSGQGAQSLTSEYEFMRGDLVRLVYDSTKDNVEYIFGKSVESFEQDDEKVTAHFSDGSSDTFDVLVGADGQGSRIRRAILPPGAPEPFKRIGAYISYWLVPREEGDSNTATSYMAPGGRMMFRRTHNATDTQIYFFLRDSSPELRSLPRAPLEEQKEFWTQRYRGAGWQTERFLEGLKTTKDFYCQELVQVRSKTWSKGRVVILGDAAYCASPLSGKGTTAALVGAYVLAGEIDSNSDNLPQAFANYDRKLRPFIDELQDINSYAVHVGMPGPRWGIVLFHLVVRIICFLRIPEIVSKFSKEEKSGWTLPDYPGFNLSQ